MALAANTSEPTRVASATTSPRPHDQLTAEEPHPSLTVFTLENTPVAVNDDDPLLAELADVINIAAAAMTGVSHQGGDDVGTANDT